MRDRLLSLLMFMALAACASPHERFDGPDDIAVKGTVPISNSPQPQTPRPPMR
jgi:hypothetical protein